MEREVILPVFPLRIVSLVPSQTELLYDLGLGDRVVGITKFCIHPKEWHQKKVRVGGTKNVNFEKVLELNPDLIIGNKEENSKSDIEELEKSFPVWMSDIESFEDAMEMIKQVASITNKEKKGRELVQQILKSKETIEVDFDNRKKVLYFIWKDPWMVAGQKTFINEMLSESGVENCLTEDRYIELSIQQIVEMKPEMVYLSSEPFPFKDKDIDELKELLPKSEIKIVDGEMFSWYGSRLTKSFDYFRSLRKV